MPTLNILDVCSYIGLAAVAAIAVNILLGLLIALRYSPKRMWPHRAINIFRLHTWTAYAVLACVLAHPAVLLFSNTPAFRVVDVMFPVASPVQPVINTVGAAAAYLVLLVMATSMLRTRIARPLWRKVHYLVFPATGLLLVHGIWADPSITSGKTDLLDGGKVFLYVVLLLLVAANSYRWRRRGVGFRPLADERLKSAG